MASLTQYMYNLTCIRRKTASLRMSHIEYRAQRQRGDIIEALRN